MNLGVKEAVLLSGLVTLVACHKQETPSPELTSGTDTMRTKVHTTLDPKGESTEDGKLMSGQLTGNCTNDTLPDGQFPMLRGKDLVKTLDDGTCIESIRDGKDWVLYAIHGNRKIKFANPDSNQETKILGQDNFNDLQELGIHFQENIYANAGTRPVDGGNLRVLFEGPIDNCPVYRYRRIITADVATAIGVECIWRKRTVVCPTITTLEDSNLKQWTASAVRGGYAISPTDYPMADRQPSSGSAPTPQEWLGNQPPCPKPDSVINKDI